MFNEHPKVAEAALSAPPAAVAGLTLVGVSLQDWVMGVTLLWLAVQISWFAYQRYKDFTGKGEGKDVDG